MGTPVHTSLKTAKLLSKMAQRLANYKNNLEFLCPFFVPTTKPYRVR